MNNVSGHIAILAGAGVAAALLGLATYLGQRMETAASAQAPVVVTVPARPSQPTVQPGPRQPSTGAALPQDPTALARQLQSELKRVGCYDGEISGAWTPRTREAMKAFTTRVNATLPVDKPDHILLALVQGHRGVACAPTPVLAKAPEKPEPPGERPLRSLRHGGPVPEVGIYERRPRRTARSYRQVRYARALMRSLQRAAMTPWRLP